MDTGGAIYICCEVWNMKRICAMMLCMMFMIMAALPLSAACADADRTADAALNHYDMDISLDMDSGRLHEKIRLRLTNQYQRRHMAQHMPARLHGQRAGGGR